MKNIPIIPPIGMCGFDHNIKLKGTPLLAHTEIDKEYVTSGKLSIHNTPVIPVRLMNGGTKTGWVDAMIDTGSYYSHVKKTLIDAIGLKPIDFFEGNHPIQGNINNPVFGSAFQISNIPVGFSTCFMLMDERFNYDVIIGSHFFDICDLHIFSKEKRFELIIF